MGKSSSRPDLRQLRPRSIADVAKYIDSRRAVRGGCSGSTEHCDRNLNVQPKPFVWQDLDLECKLLLQKVNSNSQFEQGSAQAVQFAKIVFAKLQVRSLLRQGCAMALKVSFRQRLRVNATPLVEPE